MPPLAYTSLMLAPRARLALTLLLSALSLQPAPADSKLFDYDSRQPLDIQSKGSQTRDGIEIKDITFSNGDRRIAAYLIDPPSRGRRPAVLFVHWYGPEFPTSNRTQYLAEGIALAKKGAASLHVETMWSEPEWFPKRDRNRDYENTIQQAKELRRALDVLLSLRNIDRNRLTYVGHDFGAMFGAILANVDRRPNIYAFQAGTAHFTDWYLYGPKLPEPERAKFVGRIAPLDPIEHMRAAAPAPLLYQFSKNDPHVPVPNAEHQIAATKDPKKVLWYDAGHELNDEPKRDRLQWLLSELKLN